MRRRRVGAALLAGAALVSVATGCSKDKDDPAAFCAAVTAAPNIESIVVGFTDQDPSQLDRNLAQAKEAYRKIADNAPKEIKSEAEATVELLGKVIDIINDNHDDRATASAEIQRLTERYQDSQTAATKVAEYTKKTCHVDLNPGLAPTTTTAP